MRTKHHLSDQGQVKQVGIWIRVSTEDQVRGESPEHHEQRARFYAQAKDWHVREVYHLDAISGKSVMGLPETERMLNDVRTGRISGLIFSKLARLARNTRELLEFADIFREYDAELISLQEAIDTSTPAGRLFYTLISAMAQWEREEIAERVAASVPIRARLGKSLGGGAPFGYRWENKRLVPEPKEAPVRKLMFELFLRHQRMRAVARALNESGYRTRNGAKFSGNTIERLITDPIAKGLRRSNYTKSLGDKKQWKLKPESEWVFFPAEAIVSEELWEQCNAIINQQKMRGKRPARRVIRLFSGLAYCTCGHKLYVPSKTQKYVCFKCRNKIGMDDLESVYHEQLKSFFFSPREITELLSQADQQIKEKEELLRSLERETQKIQKEMDVVFRLYMDEKISGDGFYQRHHPLEERLRQINEEMPQLQGEIDFLKIQQLSSDHILTEARDIYSRWPDLDLNDKRAIVENTVQRITIGQDDIDIDLCYLPASIKEVTNSRHGHRGSSQRRA